MMEFDYFNLDVVIFVIFLIFVIGIQVVEYFWCSDIVWMPIGTLKHIYIYPIEGGFRKEVIQADCSKTNYGLTFFDKHDNVVWKDRKYLIYTSQRNELEELEIPEGREPEEDELPDQEESIELETTDDVIDLHNPDFITLQSDILKHVQLDKVRTVKYPDNTITYIRDCGYQITRILSKFCGKTTRFSRLGSQTKYVRSLLSKSRRPKMINGEIVNYKYLNPEFSMCLLVNDESLKILKSKIDNDDLTHLNFRPNFVIEAPEYYEDRIESLKIGSVEFNNVLPCAVGEYVNIDPEAGTTNSHNQPYSTLAKIRKLKNVRSDISTVSDIPVFGITLDISRNGAVTVGDIVYAKYRNPV